LVGASPLILASIKLGLSWRTNAASSPSGSASFAFSPPSAAAYSANSCRRSAACSTSRSALLIASALVISA
jgi:hypothetical protein